MKFMTVLLEHGADVDHQDKEGITALHRSCASGHLEAVKLLLRYKAFPNFTDTARCVKKLPETGFVRVMENLESQGT